MLKKNAVKEVKKKLTPAERSEIAKDRWAKRRKDGWNAAKVAREAVQGVDTSIAEEHPVIVTIQAGSPPPVAPGIPVIPQNPTPEQPPVAPESIVAVVEERTFQAVQHMQDMLLSSSGMRAHIESDGGKTLASVAPQLIPVAPKKQKRYTGPKEFSVALKAAENRLAKAIVERAEAAGKMAMLQAEIPSLVQIISALKGQQSIPAVPYDPYATNAQFQSPMSQQYVAPVNPLAAIQAAMATAPVSRASGGAMQFSPEMVGSLEGPDDDDPDRFIAGPNAGGGWIGG